MIQLAWELGNNDEFLVGLPKSAESEHWDVAGKAVSAGTSDGQDIDFDMLRPMLQGLLAERFGLKVHMEERPVSAYTMTATKDTKLQKADPQYRTNCKSGSGPTPILNRQITCQNTNMTQLAEKLQSMVSGYVRAPVKDATGIEGSWDFSFNFSSQSASRRRLRSQQHDRSPLGSQWLAHYARSIAETTRVETDSRKASIACAGGGSRRRQADGQLIGSELRRALKVAAIGLPAM